MRKVIIILISLFTFVFFMISMHDVVALSTRDKTETNITDNEFLLDSFLFTKKEDEKIYLQTIKDLSGFTEKISNDKISVYTNTTTGAIRVLNKKTGHFWTSDIVDIEQYNFNKAVTKKMTSGFLVSYRVIEKNKLENVYTTDTEVTLNEKKIGDDTLRYEVSLSKAEISFVYEISIHDNKLNIKLDYESIQENVNKLTAINFFPYLGATYKTEVPGYLFIPSGNGALIRLDQEPLISSTYTVELYGTDANYTMNVEDEILSLPIYGIVQGVNQNAVLVEVKNGTGFANFNYSPSSTGQYFNFSYFSFNYRETYMMTIPGSDSILMVPDELYKNDIEIEYTFLDNEQANYVGFAKSYQDTLVERGILSKTNNNTTDISMQVEAFGSDYERGLIFKKTHKMTSTKDILNINSELKENNITNIFYTLRAFNKGGYSNQKVNNLTFERKLGKLSDLNDLETYYYYNPIESYNYKNNATTNTFVNMYNEKGYVKVEDKKYKFYANIKAVLKYTNKAIDKYDQLALDGLGYRLYGDKNNAYTRTEVLSMYEELLSDIKIPMYTPNYYFYKNTSKYLNMPLYHDRLRFITDSVPFLQILLKGYIDYYSPYLNFSSNLELDILKCIEYGCYPAYLITEEQSYLLNDTLSSNYYATNYEASKEHIINEYKQINEVLKHFINATIINRIVLETGVYQIIYSNSKSIIVNYSNEIYDYQGKPINSMGYIMV